MYKTTTHKDKRKKVTVEEDTRTKNAVVTLKSTCGWTNFTIPASFIEPLEKALEFHLRKCPELKKG